MNSVALGMPVARRAGPAAGPAGSPVTSSSGPRPDDDRLIDTFGRVATDLRVSLTDRCSLRCSYCMPPEGLDWLPGDQVLDDAEVIHLITIAVQQLGVQEIRFTGGEPLLRRGLERIVEATGRLRTAAGAPVTTALTTNGIGLAKRARALREAGLNRVNVSLDTLDPARFLRITHRDRLPDVLAGLHAAAEAGLGPVKVNTVLLPGVNDDEAVPLLAWAIEHGYELRFIEQMPLDAQGAWKREAMVTAAQILGALQTRFELTPIDAGRRGTAPAETWEVAARTGGEPLPGPAAPRVGPAAPRVGIVASVTRPFCGDCDRTRLTADGQIRNCLFAHGETDLRSPLRSGGTDQELAGLWRAAMWGKRAGHGIDDPSFLQPERPMSAIGG